MCLYVCVRACSGVCRAFLEAKGCKYKNRLKYQGIGLRNLRKFMAQSSGPGAERRIPGLVYVGLRAS